MRKILGSILAVSLAVGVASAHADDTNMEYGVIKSITYNTPSGPGSSILIELKADPQGFSGNSQFASCYPDGVQTWYMNLSSEPLVVEATYNRLREAEKSGELVKFYGEPSACAEGGTKSLDTIWEFSVPDVGT
tara:strand:+ start:637 stop:1038 length:402 start_codon:yes stop_codon:yes gene_type:complete